MTRGVPHLLPDQFAQKTPGGGFVSVALDQNIKLNPVLIDSTPEPLLRSADRDDNFIQVPLVAGHRQTTTNSVGEFLAEFQRPPPDRFVTDVNASCGQHLFDHPQA
jgi:hypothetical protein